MAADHKIPAMTSCKHGHGQQAKQAGGTVHDQLEKIGHQAGTRKK